LDYSIISIDFISLCINSTRLSPIFRVIPSSRFSAFSSSHIYSSASGYFLRSINLESANGYDVKRIVSGNYTLLQIGLYFAAMFLVAFLELLFVSSALESLFTIALSRKILLGASSFYFICSLFIAAAAVCIVLASGRKKGIGVVINGKK